MTSIIAMVLDTAPNAKSMKTIIDKLDLIIKSKNSALWNTLSRKWKDKQHKEKIFAKTYLIKYHDAKAKQNKQKENTGRKQSD